MCEGMGEDVRTGMKQVDEVCFEDMKIGVRTCLCSSEGMRTITNDGVSVERNMFVRGEEVKKIMYLTGIRR